MSTSTTMTIRILTDVKEKLERLSANTRRSKSFLAGEAFVAYVEYEISIIEGTKRGLADVDEGLFVSHEDAMSEISAAIDNAKVKPSRNGGCIGRAAR
jgi:predicted transcriptional regulator